MKPIIILDIDDTLHDLNELIRQEGKKHDVHYEKHEVRDWGWLVDRFGLDKFLEILHDIHAKDEHILHDDAVDSCKHLDSLGYELHYFTDRPNGYDEITKSWLEKHGFPQSENVHVCLDKRGEIERLDLKRVVAIFDDRPRTMIWALHELGIPHVFALRTSYNQNLTDIPGIHIADNWPALMQLFDSVV